MAKIKVYARMRTLGSSCVEYRDVPDEWDTMTEAERRAYVEQCAKEHHDKCVDFGAFAVCDHEVTN